MKVLTFTISIVLYIAISRGLFVIRLFKNIGFYIKDTKRQSAMFSERNGYRGVKIGRFYVGKVMKALLLLLAPMLAIAQRHGNVEFLGNVIEVKGEFKATGLMFIGCSCWSVQKANVMIEGCFDCRINNKGEIYCKAGCFEGDTCHTFDGTAWVNSNCCYYFSGRKDEQCLTPLPPISFFKITSLMPQA